MKDELVAWSALTFNDWGVLYASIGRRGQIIANARVNVSKLGNKLRRLLVLNQLSELWGGTVKDPYWILHGANALSFLREVLPLLKGNKQEAAMLYIKLYELIDERQGSRRTVKPSEQWQRQALIEEIRALRK